MIKAMENKRAKRTDTREKILEESAKLFAEKGYSATGIDEIARNVGITKSVIYYHFKNKEDILQTLIQEACAEFKKPEMSAVHKHLHETGEGLDEAMKLMEILKTERNQLILKIIFMESLKDNKEENPLFAVWDLSLDVHRDFDNEYVRKLVSKDPQMMIKVFFLSFIPILSYFIFQKRLCAQYNIREDQAYDAFREGLVKCFSEMVKGAVMEREE